jgi:hypothetical protein
MQVKFICHKDFENLKPIDVFHKELSPNPAEKHAESLYNRHTLFRKKVVLEKASKAILKITADDYFKLYINGVYVTQGPPPSYPNHYYFMEIDVTSFLKEGVNTFAVHTYYQGLINRVWVSGDLRSMFWCELYLDGKVALVSDESWLTATHTGYSSCGIIGYETAFAERYDSSAKEVGFEKESFDDSQWQPASIYKQTDYILQKSPIQPLSVYLKKPIYTERKGEVLFVDFGQEMVGYLTAKAKGKQGDKVLLRFGEELNPDGSVRFDMRCNCRYEEEWILSGKEDVLDQFDYKAFRYCEIMIPEGASVRDVEMQVRHYPYEKKAVYETDNEQLRKVLQLCENTIKYGTQEVFVDCPTREKGQYLGDVCVSGRAQCVLTGDTTLIKKAIIDFCGSAFICKGVMAVSTSSFMQEIADYSLLLPALILWVYKRDNDKDFLRLTFPYITGVYEYFMQYSQEDGLIEGVKEKWNLVDWPDNLRDGYNFPLTKPIGYGKHNVLNAFWIGFLKAYQDICEILGEAVNIAIDNVEKSFINAFYNKETGLYCDSTQKTHSAVHSNVLPLLFDIGISETKKQKIVEYICQKKLTSMGVYMAYFTLAALMKHGEREKAELLATDKGAWLNMLEEGATTTFEAWGKNQKWNTSLFHPWATAPLIVFAKDTEVY